MNEWYYARGGQQMGPVPISEIQRLIAGGELNPLTDLVWKEGMTDWLLAGKVPELAPGSPAPGGAAPSAHPQPASGTPYPGPSSTAPQSTALSPADDLVEIVHGSEPLDVMLCISRAFELTKRHFGTLVLTGLVFFGIMIGFGVVIGVAETVLGVSSGAANSYQVDPNTGAVRYSPSGSTASPIASLIVLVLRIISHIVSIFLSLGVTRICLKLVSGEDADVGMIFGEGSKLLRTIGASIIYGLMVCIGLLFLIVPGIYLAIRFGQFQAAIVDRDMGVFDSLAYSSSLTTNNRLSLFVLGLLCFLIVLAGMIALCVGLIFAYPVVLLSGIVAYRWMQYGPVVVQDRFA